MTNGTINENIKNFRTFRGITQSDLAQRIGKSKNVISNWERGDNSPDVDSVEKICRELTVTPNQLFGWDVCPEYVDYLKRIERAKRKLIELEGQKADIQARIDRLTDEVKMIEVIKND